MKLGDELLGVMELGFCEVGIDEVGIDEDGLDELGLNEGHELLGIELGIPEGFPVGTDVGASTKINSPTRVNSWVIFKIAILFSVILVKLYSEAKSSKFDEKEPSLNTKFNLDAIFWANDSPFEYPDPSSIREEENDMSVSSFGGEFVGDGVMG